MTDRMRNIVASYMRDGLNKGEAVRAAAELVERLEKQKAALAEKRRQSDESTLTACSSQSAFSVGPDNPVCCCDDR